MENECKTLYEHIVFSMRLYCEQYITGKEETE